MGDPKGPPVFVWQSGGHDPDVSQLSSNGAKIGRGALWRAAPLRPGWSVERSALALQAAFLLPEPP
jgi:hypothetical protein